MSDQIGQGGLCALDGAKGPAASDKDGEKPSDGAELDEFRDSPAASLAPVNQNAG